MTKAVISVSIEELIKDYEELQSSYKVAEKHKISATTVKRLLKKAGVLRTQNAAAATRNKNNPSCGKYVRSDEQKAKLSELASKRIGKENPFFGKKHSDETKAKLSESSKKRTGERNPNYKDGKYLRRPRDYKIRELTKLRHLVFNRDKYLCYYCKLMGGHLHAHHKIPYWVKPEAFLDSNNLITVCSTCHFEKAHKGNWANFDLDLISDDLLKKYSLCRERLNESTSKL